MPPREAVRNVVQLDAHAVDAVRLERLRALVTVAMRQVEQSVGDAGHLMVKRHVREPDRNHGDRLVCRKLELDGWRAQDFERLLQAVAVEHQGTAVLFALVMRQIGGGRVGTPFAGKQADAERRLDRHHLLVDPLAR